MPLRFSDLCSTNAFYSAKETTDGNGILSESNGADSEVATNPQIDENGGESTFTYERLKAKSSNPVSGIDYKRREVCKLKSFDSDCSLLIEDVAVHLL
ncbi:hypothetical protein BHM03_00011980 [Ensete ventricosum]|nr:hypothetical protein BHM03_00011980 [Ensete ventricosum]